MDHVGGASRSLSALADQYVAGLQISARFAQRSNRLQNEASAMISAKRTESTANLIEEVAVSAEAKTLLSLFI